VADEKAPANDPGERAAAEKAAELLPDGGNVLLSFLEAAVQ
jgi:hypothetical protein